MKTGLMMEDCHNCTISFQGYGCDVGIDMKDCKSNNFIGETVLSSFSAQAKKIGRNSPCPCGSGLKFKRCHGNGGYMSTGIRSDNSTFTVGTATIIADTAVDLKNGSNGHINVLNHISPDTPALAEVLKNFPVQPPSNLLQDAIGQHQATGTIERSKLKEWFDKQGLNLAFWAQLSVAIAGLAIGKPA